MVISVIDGIYLDYKAFLMGHIKSPIPVSAVLFKNRFFNQNPDRRDFKNKINNRRWLSTVYSSSWSCVQKFKQS